jgi:hypothetical protein
MSKITPPAVVDSHQRYSIPEAAAILRQSRAQTYKDIARDPRDVRTLRVYKEGARTFIHGSELIRRSRVGMPAENVAA